MIPTVAILLGTLAASSSVLLLGIKKKPVVGPGGTTAPGGGGGGGSPGGGGGGGGGGCSSSATPAQVRATIQALRNLGWGGLDAGPNAGTTLPDTDDPCNPAFRAVLLGFQQANGTGVPAPLSPTGNLDRQTMDYFKALGNTDPAFSGMFVNMPNTGYTIDELTNPWRYPGMPPATGYTIDQLTNPWRGQVGTAYPGVDTALAARQAAMARHQAALQASLSWRGQVGAYPGIDTALATRQAAMARHQAALQASLRPWPYWPY